MAAVMITPSAPMPFVKLRTDFIGNVSHELKTPLTRMRLIVEMLSDKKKSMELKSEINFLNDLINFQMYRSQKINHKLLKLIEFFSNQIPPKFNVKAKLLMDKFNLKEGKELGQKLKELEIVWINNSFNITDKQIEKIVKS